MSESEKRTTRLKKAALLPTRPAFRIDIACGPDAGAVHNIDDTDPERILVGTSPTCQIRLTDPFVSRRHLSLSLSGSKLDVEDLDSTNGTFVNSVSVSHAHLTGGEVIQAGSTELRVRKSDPREARRLPSAARFGRVVGASAAMRKLYPICERLAAADIPVLIEGETGTGKELLAESLHEASARADQPFVVFDCSTVASTLIESRLFGHERGAYTGASTTRKGVFELAHRGTLFIDEIGDLELNLQSRLLRAIDRSQVSRLGGDKLIRVDVRIIAATHRNLDRAVQDGQFREDLFYRLAVGRIELPPLRRRTDDVTLLASKFWRELAGDPGAMLPPDLVKRIKEHTWPGNVRELRNAIIRFHALGDFQEGSDNAAEPPSSEDALEPNFLSTVLQKNLPLSQSRHEVLRTFESLYLARMLRLHNGNVRLAADAAGVARRYFNILLARNR